MLTLLVHQPCDQWRYQNFMIFLPCTRLGVPHHWSCRFHKSRRQGKIILSMLLQLRLLSYARVDQCKNISLGCSTIPSLASTFRTNLQVFTCWPVFISSWRCVWFMIELVFRIWSKFVLKINSECVPKVFEIVLKCVWNVFETCCKSVRILSEICLQYVWNVFEMCSNCVWNVFGVELCSKCVRIVCESVLCFAMLGFNCCCLISCSGSGF